MEKKLEQLVKLAKSMETLTRSVDTVYDQYRNVFNRVVSEVSKDRKEGEAERAFWGKLYENLLAVAPDSLDLDSQLIRKFSKGFTKRLAAAKAADKRAAIATKKAEAKAKALAKKVAKTVKAEAAAPKGAEGLTTPSASTVTTSA